MAEWGLSCGQAAPGALSAQPLSHGTHVPAFCPQCLRASLWPHGPHRPWGQRAGVPPSHGRVVRQLPCHQPKSKLSAALLSQNAPGAGQLEKSFSSKWSGAQGGDVMAGPQLALRLCRHQPQGGSRGSSPADCPWWTHLGTSGPGIAQFPSQKSGLLCKP